MKQITSQVRNILAIGKKCVMIIFNINLVYFITAVAGAKELYSSTMESICGGNKPFLNSHFLDGKHLRIKDRALEQFTLRPKMGGEEFSEKYKDQLEQVSV